MKFKDSAIDTDTVPKKGEVEAVGADFGELADASSSKQEALGAADEEADILSKSLGGDFVLEDTLVFDTPQADSKAGDSVGASSGTPSCELTVALVSSDKYDTAALIEKLGKNKNVAAVEPNYYINTNSFDDYSLNDEYSSYLYHVNSPAAKNTGGDSVDNRGFDPETALSVNASSGWSKLGGDEKEAVVAVVDSGVNYNHEDLKDVMWVNPGNIGLKGTHGYNFAYKNDDPIDDAGHGTHCAGIIAAQANNGKGVAGIASKANIKIMALKTLAGTFGSSTAYANYGAFNYIHKAVQGGVNVVAVNNSWGGTSYSTIYDDLIDMLGADGVVSVVAAGNDGVDNDNNIYHPANSESDYAVTVGAACMNGKAAAFSNYGKASVDVFAPGVNILSTVSYKSFFPSIYSAQLLNATTEYYGEFNADTKVIDGTVTPSTGAKAGAELKAFGSLQFVKQSVSEDDGSSVVIDDGNGDGSEYGDDGDTEETAGNPGDDTEENTEEPGNDDDSEEPVVYPEAELQLSVVKGEHFISDNPYRLKVTLKNANPGENYYLYFPYEKNPLTTGDDNTVFSFNAESISSECTAETILHCGEVCKDENGRLTLTDAFGYGNGLDLAITSKGNDGIQRHAVNPGTEGTKFLLSADEAEGKEVGLGICIKGEWNDGTNDFSFYLDSIAVSKPDAAIDPNSSYEVMSGTSMACPSATGACALTALLNPRQDGESGSDYAKRIRAAFLSTVRQTEEFEDQCSTGGYVDLSMQGANIPAITDAVCDVDNETITLYGENLYAGVVTYKSLLTGGDYKNLPDEMTVETVDGSKKIIISNAKSLFSTYTCFAVTSPEGKRGEGKFFLVKGQNKLEEVSSYTKPQTEKLETPYLATDADGKKLYGYYNQTGTVSYFDGEQFNPMNSSDLNKALLEYLVSIGLDRYEVYNGFQATLLPPQTPVIENGVIYTFAFVNPPNDYFEDEDADEYTLMGTVFCLCSFDLNDENPHWSVKRIESFPGIFNLVDFQTVSCFHNGKMYVLPSIDSNTLWAEDTLNMYSVSPETGEWTEEPGCPAFAGGFDFVSYGGKLYAMFGFKTDISLSVEQRTLKSVWCFDGEKWEQKSDIDLVGRIINDHDKLSRNDAVAKVKNGIVFINTSVDGGNAFLYVPNTEEIAPLYYTESDSLSDSFGTNHSCAVTRDGIYYIYQTEDEYNRGWKLCLLPESSGVYESPFNDDMIWGDADGDGKVTISNATMIQKYLAEFEMPGNFVLESCDVDGDGSVTVSDVTCIQKYLADYESGTGRTGEKLNAGTAHKLVKSVKKYTVDYLTKEWTHDSTTNLAYKNAYPTVIEMVYSDEDLGSATTFLNYTFENNLPKTFSVTYDYSDEKKTIEYNNGSVYTVHVDYESGGFSDTWYQYANGDGYFTSLFREDHIAGTDFFPEQFAEETDSVQVTVENGLLKKTVNSGYYANWNEREPKKWLQFNGTYTAEYDSDGIAKTMSAVFRNGKDGIQYQIEVKKVNGVITEAVVKQPDGSGSLTETTKYEFEYIDTEISAARYSQMMNYFIIGAGSNYYNNNWY